MKDSLIALAEEKNIQVIYGKLKNGKVKYIESHTLKVIILDNNINEVEEIHSIAYGIGYNKALKDLPFSRSRQDNLLIESIAHSNKIRLIQDMAMYILNRLERRA